MKHLPLSLTLAITVLSSQSNLALAVKSNEQTVPTLGYHQIKTDAEGKIIPWNSPTPNIAYDDIIERLWKFWDNMKTDYNGLPYYMNHLVWRDDFNDERGMGGDQFAMILSSWKLLYTYTGNESVKENMRFIADYYLSQGLSPKNCRWPNLPFPYATKVYSGIFDGDMILGPDFTQPDKAGSFGWELIHLYRMTEQKVYLNHAIKIANTLAKKYRKGDLDRSPWPFKVNVYTGKAGRLENNDRSGKITGKSDYTTNYSGTIELFLALADMNLPKSKLYKKRAEQVIEWMVNYPLKNNKWGPFFEDVPGWSDTQINAVTFAQFIMAHTDLFPNWKSEVEGIFNWVNENLGNDSWKEYGVRAINEQTAYRVPGNSHTSRQASAELHFAKLTKDSSLYEGAIRKLNWATYMVNEKGWNRYLHDDIWFTDGYGDYIRHYLRSMIDFPELTPTDENHILSSTAVIQRVDYAPQLNKFLVPTVDPSSLGRTLLYYRTDIPTGEEYIKLSQKPQLLMIDWKPVYEGGTEGNRWRWEELPNGGGLLYVTRVDSRNVSVEIE